MIAQESKKYKNLRSYVSKQLLILPFIEDDPNRAEKWFGHGLINIYYKDTNKPEWEEKIILLYNSRTMDLRPITNWNLNPYKYQTYEEEYNGKLYRIFAFIIPPKWKKDYKLIIDGNYTKISFQAKSHIMDFYEKKDPRGLSYSKTVNFILNPPILCTKNEKGEYTDAFGEKQILNINQVPL